jgi:hypothetical protein
MWGFDMEKMRSSSRSASAEVRRVIAIVLTLLSLVFLFWPPSFYVSDKNGDTFTGASFPDMQLRFSEGTTYAAERYSDGIDDSAFAMVLFVMCFYHCILLAIASAIVMLLKKAPVVPCIYAVFTFLIFFGCILYLVLANSESIREYPGAGLYLLPMSATAAMLLYSADRRKAKKTAAPVPAPPAPPPVPPVKSKPALKPPVLISTFKGKTATANAPKTAIVPEPAETPNPAEDEGEPWQCPLCGRINIAGIRICPDCNTLRN